MTMHPDNATPWQRPHRHPDAFARMVEPPRRRSAVWSTLARSIAGAVLFHGSIGVMLLAAVAVAWALGAYVAWPLVALALGAV